MAILQERIARIEDPERAPAETDISEDGGGEKTKPSALKPGDVIETKSGGKYRVLKQKPGTHGVQWVDVKVLTPAKGSSQKRGETTGLAWNSDTPLDFKVTSGKTGGQDDPAKMPNAVVRDQQAKAGGKDEALNAEAKKRDLQPLRDHEKPNPPPAPPPPPTHPPPPHPPRLPPSRSPRSSSRRRRAQEESLQRTCAPDDELAFEAADAPSTQPDPKKAGGAGLEGRGRCRGRLAQVQGLEAPEAAGQDARAQGHERHGPQEARGQRDRPRRRHRQAGVQEGPGRTQRGTAAPRRSTRSQAGTPESSPAKPTSPRSRSRCPTRACSTSSGTPMPKNAS